MVDKIILYSLIAVYLVLVVRNFRVSQSVRRQERLNIENAKQNAKFAMANAQAAAANEAFALRNSSMAKKLVAIERQMIGLRAKEEDV